MPLFTIFLYFLLSSGTLQTVSQVHALEDAYIKASAVQPVKQTVYKPFPKRGRR